MLFYNSGFYNKCVFSFLRRFKRGMTRNCCYAPCPCSDSRAAIDRYLLPAGPTAANPPHAAAADEWDRDRQADRRRDTVAYRDMDPAPHIWEVPIKSK